MPSNQVAVVAVADFGAPVSVASVIEWAVREGQGGTLHMLFETPDSDGPVIVNVEVSPDNSAWSATTAAQNGQAVTSESIVARGSKQFDVNIRPGVDKYVRITASGADRCLCTIRGDDILQVQKN